MTTSRKQWSLEDLTEGAAAASDVFRRERLSEEPDLYSTYFEDARSAVENLLEQTRDLLDARQYGTAAVATYREALRYVGAPPISEDDLVTLSGVKRGKWSAAPGSGAVVDVVLQVADRHRFPWLIDGRDPTSAERLTAVQATAALIATSRVQAYRRNESKRIQEDLVKRTLDTAGFSEVPSRTVNTSRDFPDPGTYCGESSVGGSKADVVIGLWDDRILCIECKSSNSAVNSYKRVVLEAGGKATKWLKSYGDMQIVPAAVIAGVFNPSNLVKAQQEGLSIWWSHAVDEMVKWIETTK